MYIDQTCSEFVQAAIATAERKQEVFIMNNSMLSAYHITRFILQRSGIIEEARSAGHEHVVLFMEQYFAHSNVQFYPIPHTLLRCFYISLGDVCFL